MWKYDASIHFNEIHQWGHIGAQLLLKCLQAIRSWSIAVALNRSPKSGNIICAFIMAIYIGVSVESETCQVFCVILVKFIEERME